MLQYLPRFSYSRPLLLYDRLLIILILNPSPYSSSRWLSISVHRTINLYLVPPPPASQGNLLLPIGDTGGVLTTLSKHPPVHYPPTNQASTLPDRPGRTSTHHHLNNLDLGGNLTARPTRPCPSYIHTPVQSLISSTGSSILLSSPSSASFFRST